ncbi:MAG: DMT family transporter [Oscillatoriales cyanobacterium]|nr:MAG: DMT family transporter [Oscillatoriales cyanobacterium]
MTAKPPNLQLSPQSWWGWLLLISPFFFWGTAMVAMKGTLDHTTPLFLAGLRLVPAGFLVLLAAALAGRSQALSWRAWAWIGAFALVDGALFQGFLAQGLARTGAGLGSVTIDSQPLAVALMARWLYGEQIGPLGWLGLLLGVLGIASVGLPDQWILQGFDRAANLSAAGAIAPWGDAWGDIWSSGFWWMLLAALSMAIGTVMIRQVSRYADPVVATGWHMILGGMPLFGLSAALETQQWQALTLTDWGSIAYATLFGSAASYGVFFFFAARGNLTSLSALTFLTPVFALLFGHWFLGEVLSSVQSAGVLLTLVSIYLVNQREQLASRWVRLWAKWSTTPTRPESEELP